MRSVPVNLKSTSRFSRVAICADIPALVAVVGDGRAPVAVDREARQQRIQLAEDRAARLVGAGGVLRAAEFEQRARRVDFGLGAVDVGLRLGIVLHFVERIGTEQVFLAVRAAALGRRRFSGAVGFLVFERHVFWGRADVGWPRPQFAEPAAALRLSAAGTDNTSVCPPALRASLTPSPAAGSRSCRT